ncbi:MULTISPECIES: hypothetical protein [Thermocrispum]|jgi:hypothetical protein|uniref:Uncharacterized protein n=1 Tax=Thermocrispum agreste TaxID=37925 RepID=A0ABD6FGW6_9PSEU|nr:MULTISPECIES: hypothetical protein [Thermocrispum]
MTEFVFILLVAAAGLLLGGVIAMWKTSKAVAAFLMVLCVMAGVGAALWYQSVS